MSKIDDSTTAMARCIYTGDTLVPGDANLRASREHIVPLALGGSDQFVTWDVSAAANSRAGNEIDDNVASLLPFLGLRHKYKLKGNRRVIPNVALKGEFAEIPGVGATLEIDSDANISVIFHNEQKTTGQLISIGSTEERVRLLLNARLVQARKRGLNILTPFGAIGDEEDIEIAILIAQRKQGKQFKTSFTFDVAAYHFAVVRLMIKIALALGHRVLGSAWTFGPGGDLLRQGLWTAGGLAEAPKIRGSLGDTTTHALGPILGIAPDKHIMAVLPVAHQTVALVALFGGIGGVATIDLGIDSLAFFESFEDETRGGCVFEILLNSDGSRRFASRTFKEVANDAARCGLLGGVG